MQAHSREIARLAGPLLASGVVCGTAEQEAVEKGRFTRAALSDLL